LLLKDEDAMSLREQSAKLKKNADHLKKFERKMTAKFKLMNGGLSFASSPAHPKRSSSKKDIDSQLSPGQSQKSIFTGSKINNI